MKVAYQGEKGAYSEAAIYKHFGGNIITIACNDFKSVFTAVKLGKVDYGLLPVENTIAGSVVRNYDLLLKEDVFVIGEIFLKIKHNLISHKNNTLNKIEKVYSHPHALKQCRLFLEKNKLKAIPEYDTAGAVKIIKTRLKEDEAAIASELSAKLYDMQIIKSNIQTNLNNITKFFLFVKNKNIPKSLKKEKTSIVFKTKHYPGALVNVLQRLSKNDVNLTKLESRPIPENPWEYVFYVDLDAGTDNKKVKLALSEMEASTTFIKILGSYPYGEEIIYTDNLANLKGEKNENN